MSDAIREAAALLGRRGGAVSTPAKAAAARINGRLGGAPRSKQKRCPCGEMTLKRAQARGHHCEPTQAEFQRTQTRAARR